MASTTDGCCLNDPNFAVICSFISNFGDKLILPEISFEELQESIEDTKAVSDLLVDLHVHLLRRIGKKVTIEKWQRSVVKFCHYFDNADAWEIEQNGYEKAKVSTKLKVLKNLLETQFDLNLKFKEKIGELDPSQLRCQPLGRDVNGGSYWYLIDKELNLRIYREEHPTLKEDEVWKVICRDRDDLAALVATLDAEINFKTEDEAQDPKREESSKGEGNGKEEEIVKKEETDSSKSLQQNELRNQSGNTIIVTDRIAGVESSPVKNMEIKKNSDSASVKSSVKISNCKKEDAEFRALIKSVIEDGCVKVEPQDDIPKSTEHMRPGESAENFKKKEERMIIATYKTTSESNEDKIHKSLENEERNDINKDIKGNTDSLNESKAEKRKLEFSEETEIESKSRKECSDYVLSGSHKILTSNCKSEKLSETVPKELETTSANLRRESVIKIGKRIDKIIPLEESAKQNPCENKEKLPQNKLAIPVKQEKEIIKNDVVVISDTDKDIEAAVKSQEVTKRINEINNSPDCYKLKEKVSVEMNTNIQYIDDNFDDKIVLMKEYSKGSEQMKNLCKERVPSPAFAINKPHAVASEEKVQNPHDVKAIPAAKTSASDKIHAEDHISEAKKSILEENVNKLHSVGDCAENILPKKCNIETEKASGFVYVDGHSQNNESRENWKILNLYKKENQFKNNDGNLLKASEDTQKEFNIEKKLGHKIYNFENESPNDDKQPNVEKLQSSKKHLKFEHKLLSCDQDLNIEHKSQSSDKELHAQNKSHGSEEEPGAGSKPCGSEEGLGDGSKPRGSEEGLGDGSKPRGSEEGLGDGSKPRVSEEGLGDGIKPRGSEEGLGDGIKPRGSEEGLGDGIKPRGSEEGLGDGIKPRGSEEGLGDGIKPRGSEEGLGDGIKPCGSEEGLGDGIKPRGSEEGLGDGIKLRGSEEGLGDGIKPRGSEEGLGTGSRPSSSEEGLGTGIKPCGSEEGLGDGIKPHGSEEGLGTGSGPSGSGEGLGTGSGPRGSEEGPVNKSRPRGSEAGPVSKSRSRGSEAGPVSKSRSRGSEAGPVSKSRSRGSEARLVSESRSRSSEARPVSESRSRHTEEETVNGNKSRSSEEEPCTRSRSRSSDKLLDIENKSSNKDKMVKIPNDCDVVNKQLHDEPKTEVSLGNESPKSTNSLPPDELVVRNTDDQHHSENLYKLKYSLDKIQTTINEEISAGNEEKKLTCKIVIKRKSSRKKDCVSGRGANGADEADDDSDKMAKNTEDDVEYKCELSSVSVDDKAEESENVTDRNEKNDCIQRVRKRKACDKLPITPSPKNDRKTVEDLSNEECLEQIPNNDKDALLQDVNKSLNRELDSKEGFSDTEESNVRTSRRLRARRTKSSGLETEKTKSELSKEVETTQGNSGQNADPENEALVTKKTRARRRTQAELICTDLIIPEEEKRTRGRKRQNTIVEEFTIGETLEEIEPKKVKGSKNFRKTNMSRLKDTEEQFSSQSDSDDMPLSKMTKATTRGRARGRGRSKSSRQPFTVLEEPVSTTPVTRKSSRAVKKKEFNSNDFDTSHVRSRHGTGRSLRGGSSTAGKGSRGRPRKKRSGSVESDKWVSDKTEGEDEEDDDEEEEELFVGELLRRSSRVRSLGTKNKLLCISTSSDEDKSETNEDTSDEEFQLPKGRNARRAAARSAGTKEAQKIEENDNDKPCCHCQKFDHPETILLCDKCDAGYHTLCLTPPLHIIPEGDWFCPPCEHKMLLEKLMTNLHELDLQLKKRERLMKRKERLAFVGISLDNILSERKENMEPNVDCPNQSVSTTRTCRVRRSINYKFTEFDELIDSAIQDDLRTVNDPDIEGATEDKDDSSQNGKDMSNITNSIEGPVSRGKDMETIMTVYSETNDLRPQGIQAKKEAGRRRGKDISNLVGKGSDSDEQYPAPRKRRPKRKLTTLDSDSYASESDEYKASEDSDVSVDVDASDYSEEEDDEDDDYEDYGTRRRSSRTSTRQNYRASRKSGRGTTRRSRRQIFDDFVVDDDYDSEESANYRRSTRASVKRKVNYREKASDEEDEMTPTEDEASEESSAEFSGLGSDDSVEPNKKLKLKLAKKKTKRIIRESLSDDDKSSRSSESGATDKNQKKLTRKRRLAVSDSESSSSSHLESGVRRSCRASTQKINFKKLLDSDSDDESGNMERQYTVTKQKKNAIMSDSDSIASDDKSSIKSVPLDKKDNDSKFSHADGAANDDANNIATVTTPSTSTTTTTTTTNNSHEAHLKEGQQYEDNTVDSSFSQMNGHDNEKDKKDTYLEKTENRTIATERHQEDNCNNDSTNDDTSYLGTSTSRSGPQVLP